MLNDYGIDTYSILSKLLKIKFSKYLNQSGIEFRAIYQMKNLKTASEFYLLKVNDIQIRFKTQREFIFHFIIFLKKNIENYDEMYKELTTRQIDEFTDEIGLERKYKQYDYFRIQQKELLKVMLELKEISRSL